MDRETIYVAHIRENTKEIQTVKEHAEATAEKCRGFSIPLLKDILYVMGLLHDTGKYQASFQERIAGKNIKVEHSTCGAIVAKQRYSVVGIMMGYCIAGHHSGIPDGGFTNDTPDKTTLQGRLGRDFEEYSAYLQELSIPEINEREFLEFLEKESGQDASCLIEQFAFFTRYCFSCLVDADSLDTAGFCGNLPAGRLKTDFKKCLEKVNHRLSSFVCKTKLQKSRALLQSQVFDKVNQNGEIYLMNMPTGSGKTLCSVKFALERAICNHKKRIIYIIPYNSIIEQTAEEFDKMFGEDASILRHQSTFSYEEDADIDDGYKKMDEDYRKIARSAAENWDADFIITTAVQFFESVYANKRGKLRKLHNMADSILIFDEAHLMPYKYLQPCLQAVTCICRYLNSEAVFLTATMPDFPKLIGQYALPDSKIINLIEDTSLFNVFRKCSYQYVGKMDVEMILGRAAKCPTSLVIVNKRQTARKIYDAAGGHKYHLSTYMTSFDRKRVLRDIRQALQSLEEDYPGLTDVPEDRRIMVVSTSLIEAGVDLDMHTVFRELSGLDSILQAGGRCNREGRRACADVLIFDFAEEAGRASLDERSNLTRGLLQKYPDISCQESIREYYDRLFFMKKEEIEEKSISRDCTDFRSIRFKQYAEQFEMIDSKTVSLVAARDDYSRELIEQLRYTGTGSSRKLQDYACTIYQKELDDLFRQHVVDDFGTGIWCLTNNDYYDENIGITFEAKDYFL